MVSTGPKEFHQPVYGHYRSPKSFTNQFMVTTGPKEFHQPVYGSQRVSPTSFMGPKEFHQPIYGHIFVFFFHNAHLTTFVNPHVLTDSCFLHFSHNNKGKG
jgi:hypothetical protein